MNFFLHGNVSVLRGISYSYNATNKISIRPEK